MSSDLEPDVALLRADVERLRSMIGLIAAQIPKITNPDLKKKVEAKRQIVQAQYEEAARDLEALEVILSAERLPGEAVMGTMGSVNQVSLSQGGAVSAGKTKTPTRFQKALHKRGMSLPEWASTKKKFRLNPETAKGWVKRPGKGGRPIPREWADRIAREFGDPALLDPDNWPNGIRG